MKHGGVLQGSYSTRDWLLQSTNMLFCPMVACTGSVARDGTRHLADGAVHSRTVCGTAAVQAVRSSDGPDRQVQWWWRCGSCTGSRYKSRVWEKVLKSAEKLGDGHFKQRATAGACGPGVAHAEIVCVAGHDWKSEGLRAARSGVGALLFVLVDWSRSAAAAGQG